jgi:hypothetical protein
MLTSDELNKINQYRPVNSPEYSEGDISKFSIMASNNLLHASMFKWDINSLKTMGRTYPGKPLMLDHEWENVMNQVGFIYDAQLLHYPNPNNEIRSHYLQNSPNKAIDNMIMDEEGIYQLICQCATETSHPITNDIMYGRKINASIGGLASGEMTCPLCNTSFDDENCPHYIPSGPLTESQQEKAAPYWIRGGYQTTMELSMVMAGNCPSARVLNSLDANKLLLY